jgi:hypothetical protein
MSFANFMHMQGLGMSRSYSAALVAMAAVTLTSAPAMAETTVLTASSPWQMDNGADSCSLKRGFGTPDNPALLEIERLGPGDRFYATITGRAFNGLAESSNLVLKTGPDGAKPIADRFTVADAPIEGGGKLTALIFSATTWNGFTQDDQAPAPVTPEREAAITSLIVSWSDKAVQLGTGSLGKAMAAMRECTDRLVRSWGLDPAQQAGLSAHPVPKNSPDTWIAANSYPFGADNRHRPGLTRARLLVDASGAVSGCTVVDNYGDAAFAAAACEQMTSKAAFSPALDQAGKPVASYYQASIRWKVRRPMKQVGQRRR